MRVVVDGWSLHPPRSGVGVYTFELLSRLSQGDRFEGFDVLMGERLGTFDDALRGLEQKMESPSLLQRGRRRLGSLPVAGPILRSGMSHYRRLRPPPEKKHVLSREHGSRPFVFHAPNYVAPVLQGNLVLTIHDFAYLRYPQMLPKDRLEWLQKGLRRSVERASRIIVVSEFTRREFLNAFDGFDASRVAVTSLGISSGFRPHTAAESAPVLGRYGLGHKGYCLFIGNLEPRKNLQRLLQAWEHLPLEITRSTPLVLVGGGGWLNRQLTATADRLAAAGIVRKLGFVPAADLPVITAGAKLFVFPSVYEGFGLPVLEAMACGVPVVTSDRASMPEVAGTAARLVDPDEFEAIASSIRAIVESDSLAADLSAQGVARARRFSWDRCARETVEVYEQAFRSP